MDFLANNPLNDLAEMGECDECSAPYSLASASDHDPETGLCLDCAEPRTEPSYCDDCGDELVGSIGIVAISRLTFAVSSANVGEGAVLCRPCYNFHASR